MPTTEPLAPWRAARATAREAEADAFEELLAELANVLAIAELDGDAQLCSSGRAFAALLRSRRNELVSLARRLREDVPPAARLEAVE